MGNRWRNSGNTFRLYFFGLQNHCRWWLQPWNKKTLAPWEKSYDQHRLHIKNRDITFSAKVHLVKAVFFPVHIWMWELDYKESWALKNWWFWTVMLETTLESPLDWKEIQPVHPKGNQSWIFIGRTDVETETPILWPPDVKRWLLWKDPELGRIEGRRRTGGQRMKLLVGITESINISLSKLWKLVMNREAWPAEVHGIAKSRTQLSDWTELNGGVNGDLLQEGLCHTQFCYIQSPCPCVKAPPTGTSMGHTNAVLSVSVGSLGPCVHKSCLSPLSIFGRNGVWF